MSLYIVIIILLREKFINMLFRKKDEETTLERLFKVKKTCVRIALQVLRSFVLVVPHITDAIQEWVERVARTSVDNDSAEPDICIIEV